MKKILNIILVVGCLFSLASCDFLDVEDEFSDTMSYDSIFASKRNIERYIWGTAALFPDEGNLLMHSHTPGPLASDEAFTTFSTEQARGIAFTLGEVTPDNLYGLGNWGSMYKVIRKANLIFSRMDEAKDLTTVDKFTLLGYTHFLRAYAYYNLLMDFGPLIIVGDEVLLSNESPNYYNTYRSTYDESVDYVCEEFEKAARYLPLNVPVSQFGRPTKGAAYALIARLRLQHASPLFNGGVAARSFYGSWVRKVDGVHYISQEYNEERWALAAATARRVMDLGNGMYELHTVKKGNDTPSFPDNISTRDFPNGIGGIDPFKSYSDMFTGESVSQTNPEFIWGRMSGGLRDITRHSFNVDILGGWNGMCITQKVIDKYKMIDGKTINNSSAEYPYNEEGMTDTGRKQFSGYILNNGISNMYANREMRFYASVGFSRRFWTASSTSESSRKNITVTYDKDGNSGRYSSQNIKADYPSTGYVITKFIHEADAWKGDGSTRVNKGFPIIRYAEILLSYVEALNNLTSSYTIELDENTQYTVSRDMDEMAKSFNQVRYRAGLPGLSSEELSNTTKMQQLIEDERMIEFLFENRRYYDVRRWGIYEDTENVPIQGMDIEAGEPDFYNRVIVNHSRVRNRIVNKRMVFLPIPKSEVRKIKDCDQNFGWPN